jgi:hypothetical protein
VKRSITSSRPGAILHCRSVDALEPILGRADADLVLEVAFLIQPTSERVVGALIEVLNDLPLDRARTMLVTRALGIVSLALQQPDERFEKLADAVPLLTWRRLCGIAIELRDAVAEPTPVA